MWAVPLISSLTSTLRSVRDIAAGTAKGKSGTAYLKIITIKSISAYVKQIAVSRLFSAQYHTIFEKK